MQWLYLRYSALIETCKALSMPINVAQLKSDKQLGQITNQELKNKMG